MSGVRNLGPRRPSLAAHTYLMVLEGKEEKWGRLQSGVLERGGGGKAQSTRKPGLGSIYQEEGTGGLSLPIPP